MAREKRRGARKNGMVLGKRAWHCAMLKGARVNTSQFSVLYVWLCVLKRVSKLTQSIAMTSLERPGHFMDVPRTLLQRCVLAGMSIFFT